jgi:hypothetical protein
VRVDKSAACQDREVELPFPWAEKHQVSRAQLILGNSTEMAIEFALELVEVIASQLVIAANSFVRDPVNGKHHSDTVEAALPSALRAVARANERLRARGITKSHGNQAPG